MMQRMPPLQNIIMMHAAVSVIPRRCMRLSSSRAHGSLASSSFSTSSSSSSSSSSWLRHKTPSNGSLTTIRFPLMTTRSSTSMYTDPESMSSTQLRRLDVAVVGAPNAGKSQLLNILTESNVAAVSRKRHTTRTGGILGARTLDNNTTQLIFWDTPGFLRSNAAKEEGLDREIMISATAEMQTVDYSLLVIDAARVLTKEYKESLLSLMMQAFVSEGREEAVLDVDWEPEQPIEKLGIVLNKVDLVHPKTKLLDMAEEVSALAETAIEYALEQARTMEGGSKEIDETLNMEDFFPSIFYTNARNAEGVEDIVQHLKNLATPCRVFCVDPDQSTNMTMLERVEETIREKIYRTLHKELPHEIKQVNRLITERPGDIVEIQQDIVVKSKSHYNIVAGRNLTSIQQMAQRDIQAVFPGKKVILHLHLKHNKGQHDRNARANQEGTLMYRRQR